jgi:hypothetical protein
MLIISIEIRFFKNRISLFALCLIRKLERLEYNSFLYTILVVSVFNPFEVQVFLQKT